MLDLRTQLFLWFLRVTGRSFRPDVSVRAMRLGYADMNVRMGLPKDPTVETEDREIETPDGASLLARIYRPPNTHDERLPVLLYFHGGGWVIGDVPSYDHLTRFFASVGRIAVVSIDYRLGPEHRFPTAFEDGFAALAWLQRNAAELGVDPARIIVGGDSAGAGIAASLSAYATQRGLARPAFQFLIYPPVDASARFPSRKAFPSGVPLTTPIMQWFAQQFFTGEGDAKSPFVTQLDAPQPELLPPTYILAAGYDPLVDEGRAYADRLRNAGVAVTYDLRPSLPHGFVNFPRIVPAAQRALDEAIRCVSSTVKSLP
jgi:acetyl esterase